MFKQFTPYIFAARNALAERPGFVPCGPSQPLSVGFVPHSNGAPLIAGIELFTIERKVVPTPVVKRAAELACDKIQGETGRRPKGKHLKEIKEGIVHELLAKAFPKRKTVPLLWLDGFLLVGSTSSSECDLIMTELSLLDDSLKLGVVQTEAEPALALTEWARFPGEAPFAVGHDLTVLLQSGGKGTFKSSNVDDPEVVKALDGGTVTSLALTSTRDVSFTLTEVLQVKKLAVGGTDGSGDHADAASADCALYRGELSALMTELMEALNAA